MVDFSVWVLTLSTFILVSTAALVYLALHRLFVRPMARLTASMAAFSNAPENEARIIRPSNRQDEIGATEQALAEMQRQLRSALLQRRCLAGVGTAVAKISHDLKGILTAAMLESDRLADPAMPPATGSLVRGLGAGGHFVRTDSAIRARGAAAG